MILRRKVWVVLIIGTIEMVLGVFVAVIPAYDIAVFNIIVAVVLLMVGFMYLLAEFTGKKYKPSMPSEMTKET